MDDDVAMEIRKALEAELQNHHVNSAIFVGKDIFFDFLERGWIKPEKFGAQGTDLFSEIVPAFNRTHCTILSHALGETQFQVGGQFSF